MMDISIISGLVVRLQMYEGGGVRLMKNEIFRVYRDGFVVTGDAYRHSNLPGKASDLVQRDIS